MKRFKSLTNRSGLFGAIFAVMATVFGITSCKPDFDLDKKFPEWLGTSIYETLKEGFRNDSTGEMYSFNTFVRLIEDLDEVSVLAKTGSKTLFVADDKAFERFFQNCPFFLENGQKVTSYDQLSKAQKTMILNGSMLNNVYQVAMLSSSPGDNNNPPLAGTCMRRVSASNVLDTIPVLKASDFPKYNSYWNRLRTKNAGRGIVLLQDGSNKPIIFFVNKFLTSNRIDTDDYDFLFRLGRYSKVGKPAHRPGDASINGTSIAWPNKKCFNGFLHVMEDVVYLLPNMADYIATNPNSQIFSSILERFSVPTYSRADRADRDENIRMLLNAGLITSPALEQAMSGNSDSVFVKKYLSSRAGVSQNKFVGQSKNLDEKSANPEELLRFDPGWNSYISSTNGNNAGVALQTDMGLMMVPLDSALMAWWLDESQVGARLRATFGLKKDMPAATMTKEDVIEDMAGIPMDVVVELVNNNMQYSLVSSVPSKFPSVLNDAQDPFFEDKTRTEAENTIDDVVMCCNGAIYFTSTVYVPTTYRSVAYPVIVNQRLKIIDYAIRSDKKLAYKAYLNSMVAEYSFFVPLLDSIGVGLPAFKDKLVWIDPASFYLDANQKGQIKALAFSYGKVDDTEDAKPTIMANVYDYDLATGTFTDLSEKYILKMKEENGEQVADESDDATAFFRNRLQDIMDYHIIIGDVETPASADPNGYSYFRTKGRGTIRFKGVSDPVHDYENMIVQGGWQIENEGKGDAIERPVKVVQRVDLSKKTSLTPGNGRTYIIDRPLLPSRKSVFDILSDSINYPEFLDFYHLMKDVGIFAGTSNGNYIGAKNCVSSFNTYHYTVYVPKNESLKPLYQTKRGLLTLDQLDSIMTAYNTIIVGDIKDDYADEIDYDPNKVDSVVAVKLPPYLMSLSMELFGIKDSINAVKAAAVQGKTEKDDAYNARFGAAYFVNKKKDQMKNFVNYHIQDNSVYIGAEFNAGIDDRTGLPALEAEYETAFMNSNQQFVKLTVKGGAQITVKDKKDNVRQVQQTKSPTDKPYYNIMCREYEIKSSAGTSTLDDTNYGEFVIETSSYAVVHLIDEPLFSGDMNFE
jgi:uncharacterized surface protein with fasciclin (FAS1) repeats